MYCCCSKAEVSAGHGSSWTSDECCLYATSTAISVVPSVNTASAAPDAATLAPVVFKQLTHLSIIMARPAGKTAKLILTGSESE